MKFFLTIVVLSIFASLAASQTAANGTANSTAYPSIGILITSRNGTYEKILLTNISAVFTHPWYNASRPTAFYASGWSSSNSSKTTIAIRDAYLARGNYNFLVIDWFDYNQGCYFQVAKKVRPIANQIAAALVTASNNTANNFTTTHFIGHSLGAQLWGFIGRQVQNITAGALIFPRLTALDPAGPLFFTYCNVTAAKPLNKTDFKFVDVVHTDTYFASTATVIGHVDYYPNQGSWQRGCPSISLSIITDLMFDMNATRLADDVACSHYRACHLYAESVRNPTSMPMAAGSTYCVPLTFFGYVIWDCPPPPANVYFGFGANTSMSGTFVFKTSNQSLFGLGAAGTVFSRDWSPFN